MGDGPGRRGRGAAPDLPRHGVDGFPGYRRRDGPHASDAMAASGVKRRRAVRGPSCGST